MNPAAVIAMNPHIVSISDVSRGRIGTMAKIAEAANNAIASAIEYNTAVSCGGSLLEEGPPLIIYGMV